MSATETLEASTVTVMSVVNVFVQRVDAESYTSPGEYPPYLALVITRKYLPSL